MILSRTINLSVKRNKNKGGDIARVVPSHPLPCPITQGPNIFAPISSGVKWSVAKGGGEVKGREGSRSRIRVFAPLAQSTPPHVLAMRGQLESHERRRISVVIYLLALNWSPARLFLSAFRVLWCPDSSFVSFADFRS